MSYSEDAVLAKLSTLNETQEGIVTVAQWLMFHKSVATLGEGWGNWMLAGSQQSHDKSQRYADNIAHLWARKLSEVNPPRRLQLIYVLNEVIQQTRAKRREEFSNAFGPILPEALGGAYRGAGHDLQGKIRYVVEVWRSRGVLQKPILDRIEAKFEELDKARGGRSSASGMLRSSGSSAIPEDFRGVINAANALGKQKSGLKAAIAKAEESYTTASTSILLDDAAAAQNPPLPAPPVQAAQLSTLMKTLASAEGALKEGIRARNAMIEGLNKILTANIQALEEDRFSEQQLSSRRHEVEAKKIEVENRIMREMGSQDPTSATPLDDIGNGEDGSTTPTGPPPPPPGEELRPPAVEAFTPPGSPGGLPFSDASHSPAQIPLPTSPGPFAAESPPQSTMQTHFPPGLGFGGAGGKRDSLTAFGMDGQDERGVDGAYGAAKRMKGDYGEQGMPVSAEGFDQELQNLLRQERGTRVA